MLFRLAMRNIARNVRRTALTASTVLIGTALFVVAVAWNNGIFHGMLAELAAVDGDLQIVAQEWAEKEILQPTYANLPDVKALTDAVANVPGIDQVEPRIAVGVIVTANDEIGDHFARVVGASPSYFERRFHGPDKILQGKWLTGGPEEVVLGRKIAQRHRRRCRGSHPAPRPDPVRFDVAVRRDRGRRGGLGRGDGSEHVRPARGCAVDARPRRAARSRSSPGRTVPIRRRSVRSRRASVPCRR